MMLARLRAAQPGIHHDPGQAWRRSRILAGEPHIGPATQGHFVPQMLNLHWLQGVDFHKGCYPGQEIVARLQYRGRLTRWLRLAQLDAETAPEPGTPVFTDDNKNVGEVIDSVAESPGRNFLLAVIQRDAAPAQLRIDGHVPTPLPLPYPTPDADSD